MKFIGHIHICYLVVFLYKQDKRTIYIQQVVMPNNFHLKAL